MNAQYSNKEMWFFLAHEMRENWGAPIYATLCEAIGEDNDLLEIGAKTRPGQPTTQILAAVQYLLLRGADHDLRQHFPSLSSKTDAPAEKLVPLFKDFCRQHRDAIIELVSTRATNTNEIARSSGLNAGFRALAATAPAPFHLVEIGPSAGFNLLWDRYQINYVKDGKSHSTDTPNALLEVTTELRGNIPPVGRAPSIASKVGLELNPVDLDNQSERDWLRAVVHADHVERHKRISKVLSLKAEDRPEIRSGDAIALLPKVLVDITSPGTVCVYHTFAVYQFSEPMVQALEKILCEASQTRTIWRLSNEYGPGGKCPLVLSRYEGGKLASEQTLGYCDMHGKWIEWL